jgi:hypothetical protein
LADIELDQYQRRLYKELAYQLGFPFLDIQDHQDQEFVHHLSLQQPVMVVYMDMNGQVQDGSLYLSLSLV